MQPADGQQLRMEMEFPQLYEIADMGTTYPLTPKTIYLHPSFIRENLGGGRLSVHFEVGKDTNVSCPFCQEGRLQLASVEPEYSGGPRAFPPPVMHHVGNRYEFKCSNPNCDGRFVGTYQWMWID